MVIMKANLIVVAMLMILLLSLVFAAPGIDQKREHCQDNGGVWMSDISTCIGNNK